MLFGSFSHYQDHHKNNNHEKINIKSSSLHQTQNREKEDYCEIYDTS